VERDLGSRRRALTATSSLLLCVALVSCARHTGAAQALATGMAPLAISELILRADALQPERAALIVRINGCPGASTQVRRMEADTYQWSSGVFSDTWLTRDEFISEVDIRAQVWNACSVVEVYFACMGGVDTDVGATAECGDSIRAEKGKDGKLQIGTVARHVN
jgi:hypothetical protein